MLQPISLKQLAAESNGRLVGEDCSFNSVAIDSRSLNSGDLYIALKGERFDGHQFVEDAIQKGCAALVVTKDKYKCVSGKNIPYVEVDDTLSALGACSRINRQNFSGKVIGLTGSSGKTSTKNMLERILSEKGPTCATQGNFNNEVGVPLTLLSIKPEHKYAVVEMGARHKGDIAYLSTIVQQDVSILLNAGTAHIDIFGSRENIVRAKGEIFTALKSSGLAVVNLDDPANPVWLASLGEKGVLTYSIESEKADVFASEIEVNEYSSKYMLNYQDGSVEVLLNVPGIHNVSNSLAAAAAAIHLGFELECIANGLMKLNSSHGRLMSIPCTEQLVVIDDSYNANPSSMKAAIDVLGLRQGHKIAVLGEMAELGDFSKKLHLEVAEYLRDSNIDKVYLIGRFAQEMAELAGAKAKAAETKQAAFDFLEQDDKIFEENGAVVATSILIKGSRSTAMDELVNMIVKKAAH